MGLLNFLLFALATELTFYFILVGIQLSLTVLLVSSNKLSKNEYYLAFIFGLLARLVFITKTPLLSFDVNVYSQFASRMVNGELPYQDFYFPYPLLVAVLFAAIYSVFSSPFAFKIVFSAIDIANALLIPRVITNNPEKDYGFIASAVYMLIPITIIEAAWNGHFEAVMVLFMLLSLYYFFRDQDWKSLLFAGIGALIKYVPIGIVAGIFRRAKEARHRFLVVLFAGIALGIGYFSMVFIGSSVSVLVGGGSSTTPAFFDYSFPAFFRIVTGFSGTIGQIGLILAGGILLVGILLEQRGHSPVVSKIVKYSIFIILVIIGIGMTLYPWTQFYSQGYWRRLPEICFAQGVSILLICAVFIAKWDKLSFTEDIHLIMFVLLILMFYQPVFYAWYVLFLLPVVILLRTDETRVLLVVCLVLFPTVAVGIFSPPASDNTWVSESDISETKLNDAIIRFSTENNHSTTISVADGILAYQTNSSTTNGYAARIQWNVTNFRIDPSMIFRSRMVSSADPTYSKPFMIYVVAGFYNSTGGEYNEQKLTPSISFISNMTWITYYYKLLLQHSITPDYISLIIRLVENITGSYSLRFDSFMIENDLNVPSSRWLISVPLSLIGMLAPVLIMFPHTFSEFYYALRRLRFIAIARIKGAKLHLGHDVKLCRGSRILLERDGQLTIGDKTVILDGTEIIAHSKATINIGSGVFISRMCTISAHESIEIGSNSSIGAFCFILDTNKSFDNIKMDIRGQGHSCTPIILGADVWLGAHVVILPGSSIGSHSVVGANSTVRDSFSENSVIAGNPAEIIRLRGERRP